CMVPLFIAGYATGLAWYHYQQGEGGFKLGVDLVGGTILVYEVDKDRQVQDYKPEELGAAIKRRIDPADLKNITHRPVSNTRVEIILPTGGAHQQQIEEDLWRKFLDKVREKWPELKDAPIDVGRGRVPELPLLIDQELKKDTWKAFLAKVEEKWPK